MAVAVATYHNRTSTGSVLRIILFTNQPIHHSHHSWFTIHHHPMNHHRNPMHASHPHARIADLDTSLVASHVLGKMRSLSQEHWENPYAAAERGKGESTLETWTELSRVLPHANLIETKGKRESLKPLSLELGSAISN